MTQPEAIEKMLSGANVFLTGEPGAACGNELVALR